MKLNTFFRSKFNLGFTIIEIIVVIGIIAVLTVIIFPSIYQIRAKNRDTERVADISALQLGLSLFYSQHPSTGYPLNISEISPQYVPADSLVSPDDKPYVYIPLTIGSGPKCTYYQLGVSLELPSAQINKADTFTTKKDEISNGYSYCDPNYEGEGIDTSQPLMYQVHP